MTGAVEERINRVKGGPIWQNGWNLLIWKEEDIENAT